MLTLSSSFCGKIWLYRAFSIFSQGLRISCLRCKVFMISSEDDGNDDCNIVINGCYIDDCLMDERKHKNAAHLKYRTFFCFVLSVKFLRPWKYAETDTDKGYNVRSRFIILIGISSSPIFKWFNCLLSKLLLVSFRKESFIVAHRKPISYFCPTWSALTDQPPPTLRWPIESGDFGIFSKSASEIKHILQHLPYWTRFWTMTIVFLLAADFFCNWSIHYQQLFDYILFSNNNNRNGCWLAVWFL